MTSHDPQTRSSMILQVMRDVEESPISTNQYFKERKAPFSQAQYYLYKKILKEKGIEGLSDQRCEGNNLRFTDAMKNFVIGLLEHNRSMSTTYVRNAIENRFEITISDTTIKDFRRENDLSWVRPKISPISIGESGAAEIPIALALGTGLIDAITDSIAHCIEDKKESGVFENSFRLEKDHTDLRSKGKFTSEYNKSPSVSESRFKSLDEKIGSKRFAAMDIFSLSKNSVLRRILALFSLPLVTANGRAGSVDNPRGNALKYLCGVNYKASTIDKQIRELKYLRISDDLIESTARFWIDFWSSRNGSDSIFACYYIDGNTKALWSSKPCHKGKVTMLGRVMNCLEQVFIHDAQGHPIYFQTFNGHADLGKNSLGMMDKISEYLKDTTTLGDQITVNRILILDGGGNGVKTLRELSDSEYHFITILDSNQITDRKIKSVSEKKRYDFGDAYVVDCTIELEDSNEKGYIFETRAVQVHWDNGRTSVLITSLSEEIFTTDNVVKSYFNRWPAQELNFRDMKSGVNIHRVVGYGKKLVDNVTVLEKIEQLKRQKNELELELRDPLDEIRNMEGTLQLKINEERIYREKSTIKEGTRRLSEQDMQSLKSIQKEINSIKSKIKKIEKDHPKQFTSLKKKRDELARIIDKKKIYSVDVELDQIMTCFKISFANICCYLLDECFNGEKMTLQRLFEVIFDLQGEVRIENGCRNIFIKRNPKQPEVMKKLELALDSINHMRIEDLNGCMYNFKLL